MPVSRRRHHDAPPPRGRAPSREGLADVQLRRALPRADSLRGSRAHDAPTAHRDQPARARRLPRHRRTVFRPRQRPRRHRASRGPDRRPARPSARARLRRDRQRVRPARAVARPHPPAQRPRQRGRNLARLGHPRFQGHRRRIQNRFRSRRLPAPQIRRRAGQPRPRFFQRAHAGHLPRTTATR